jgi:hypothetical protein
MPLLTFEILYKIFYLKNCAKYGLDSDPDLDLLEQILNHSLNRNRNE